MKKLVAVCLLLVGCAQAEEKLSEELQIKVLELHDVLMPKTEQIVSLKSKKIRLATALFILAIKII